MAFAQISDQRIFYAARGTSGAPLVFIHGAGDSHLVWNGQLSALAGIRRFYALDLPGHGRSSGAGRDEIRAYADAVREFLDALEMDSATLIGVSMGGAIAQTVALEYPERVTRLGLLGTGAKLRVAPAFLDGLQADFETTARDLIEHSYGAAASPALKQKSLTQLRATGSRVTLGDYRACDAFDVRDRLGEIQVPTLVLCGREDQMTPPKYSQFLAENIPHAKLVLVENAGHMVMVEQPHALNTALRAWITA